MPELVNCGRCQAPMIFAKNRKSGRLMCLDAVPSEAGKVVLHADGTATALAKATLFDQIDPGVRHVDHHATCPFADMYRKPKAKKS